VSRSRRSRRTPTIRRRPLDEHPGFPTLP
jgi:hypothetical protein